MLEMKLCHKVITKSLSHLHQYQKDSLHDAVLGLLKSNQLTLTAIGRSLPGKTKEKHCIKRVDRLLANEKIYKQIPQINKTIVNTYFKLDTYKIIVDWTGCCSRETHQLRASLMFHGRSITIHAKEFTEALQNTQLAHQQFLDELNYVLPVNKKVIIVTDAGFRAPWFNAVLSYGWDYIGRVRGTTQYHSHDNDVWLPVSDLHQQAKPNTQYIGRVTLAKANPVYKETHLYLAKNPAKNRTKHRSPYQPTFPNYEKRFQKSGKEPWVIATSLSNKEYKKNQIIKLYSKRMQIEQNFRDDKNKRWGLAWRMSRTKSVNRIAILALLAQLANLILWMIGYTTIVNKKQYQYQANSIKANNVLSVIYLAKRVINDVDPPISLNDIKHAIKNFTCLYNSGDWI